MSPLLATATHIERTEDPAVMRWVCHRADLDAAADGRRVPPTGSPMGHLVEAGLLTGVELHGGDLLLRAPQPEDWSMLAARAHEAVLAELASDATWLTTAPPGGPVPADNAQRPDTAQQPDATGRITADGSAEPPGGPAAGCGSGSQVASAACAGCHVRSACGTGSKGTSLLRRLLRDHRN